MLEKNHMEPFLESHHPLSQRFNQLINTGLADGWPEKVTAAGHGVTIKTPPIGGGGGINLQPQMFQQPLPLLTVPHRAHLGRKAD